MLLVLAVGLLVGSLLVLCVKKNRESLLLAGICMSLIIFLVGMMISWRRRVESLRKWSGFSFSATGFGSGFNTA